MQDTGLGPANKDQTKNKKYSFAALKFKQVQTKMLMSVENRLADTVGEGERANWQSSTDIYTVLCIKYVTSGKLLC